MIHRSKVSKPLLFEIIEKGTTEDFKFYFAEAVWGSSTMVQAIYEGFFHMDEVQIAYLIWGYVCVKQPAKIVNVNQVYAHRLSGEKKDRKLTALTFAMTLEKTEILKLLLQINNLDVNFQHFAPVLEEPKPLFLSLKCEQNLILKLLLERNDIDVNVKNSNGIPFLIECLKEKPNMFKNALFNPYLEINTYAETKYKQSKMGIGRQNCLHYAIRKNNLEIVRLLTEQPKIHVNARLSNGMTPLVLACHYGHFCIVKYLCIDYPAARYTHQSSTLISTAMTTVNLNALCSKGQTALHYSIFKDDLRSCEILIDCGIDTHLYGKEAVLPLIMAIRRGHSNLVKLLVNKDAKEGVEDPSINECALLEACKFGFLKMIKILFHSEQIEINIQSENEGMSAFMALCQRGKLNMVKYFLRQKFESNVNINLQNFCGQNGLMLALSNGHLEIAKLLLMERNVDINAYDYTGATALQYAIQNHYVEIVEKLLDLNAELYPNIDDKDSKLCCEAYMNQTVEFNTQKHKMMTGNEQNSIIQKYESPLQIACVRGFVDIVKKLWDYKETADCKWENTWASNGFLSACKYGHRKIVDYLISKMVDINVRNLDGKNGLMLASSCGHIEIVQIIINKNDSRRNSNDNNHNNVNLKNSFSSSSLITTTIGMNDVNVRCRHGNSAIILAAQTGRTSIVQLLAQNGAELNLQNNQGHTALFAAMKSRHVETAVFLASQDVDFYLQDDALMCAMKLAQIGVCDALLKKRMELNPIIFARSLSFVINEQILCLLVLYVKEINFLVDQKGNTALHWACNNNKLKLLEVLLKKEKINVNQQNQFGHTPLMVAIMNYKKNRDMVHMLIQNTKIDVNIKDKRGNTSLMYAIKNSQKNMIKEILKIKNIDVNLQNDDGNTALHLASIRELRDIIPLLYYHHEIDLHLKNNLGLTASENITEELLQWTKSKFEEDEEDTRFMNDYFEAEILEIGF